MSTLSDSDLAALCTDIQFNCSVSDAQFARNYSLCIYLLRMREFYQWRFDIPLSQSLEIKEVGDWISETEFYWDDIEYSEFIPLKINQLTFDPFDIESINAELSKYGLIYSAGYGRMGQPHFVLAELIGQRDANSIRTFECGRELARDCMNLPAMAQGQTIFLRYDSIKKHIWQMLEQWRLHKNEGPLARLIEHYRLDEANDLDEKLESAATELMPLYHAHELGEISAGELLGNSYHELLKRVTGTPNEFYLRALRDMLADTLCTWPCIQNMNSKVALDFWLANLLGARLELAENAGLITQFQQGFSNSDNLEVLSQNTKLEQQRWLRIASDILENNKAEQKSPDIRNQILTLIEQPEYTQRDKQYT